MGMIYAKSFGHVYFDGVDLADFGITVSGVGTYNSPERDYELIEIPGRDGDVIVDNGRSKNISIAYPVNIEAGLPLKVQALSEFLLSHVGYFRLEDTYHPDEFRMAQFAGPIDISTIGRRNTSGKTELIFNCKPQRFLLSGEEEIELNFTEDPTGGTLWDAYIDLPAEAKAQVDELGLMDLSPTFPKFTTTRAADYVIMTAPKKNAWIYPNDHIGTGRYDQRLIATETGTTFYANLGTSPFMTISDQMTQIYTPSHFRTKLSNPTAFPAKPIIKIYLDENELVANAHARTAFGIDAENFVTFDTDADPNMSGRTAKMIVIDCEKMSAYSEDITGTEIINHNLAVNFVGDLTIPPGESVFRVSNLRADFDHIEKITIIPRWFRK